MLLKIRTCRRGAGEEELGEVRDFVSFSTWASGLGGHGTPSMMGGDLRCRNRPSLGNKWIAGNWLDTLPLPRTLHLPFLWASPSMATLCHTVVRDPPPPLFRSGWRPESEYFSLWDTQPLSQLLRSAFAAQAATDDPFICKGGIGFGLWAHCLSTPNWNSNWELNGSYFPRSSGLSRRGSWRLDPIT